tara:strand:+ start:3337 stop:4044 length:708 start_codon:yes stop_codon:yes gene_type:complete
LNAEANYTIQRWFGRRTGRKLSAARRRLMTVLLPRLRLDPYSDLSDAAALFPKIADDLWMEIGFGAGEHLVAQASRHPNIGFIGCEPYVNGVAALLAAINDKALTNIRVFDDDVRQLMPAMPAACLGRLYILFSDPWPKVRHHRRRITVESNLCSFARLLRPGAEVWFASDHTEFAAWTLERVLRDRRFTWLARRADDWRLPPEGWIETRYEQKARAQGLKPVYLNFMRSDADSP